MYPTTICLSNVFFFWGVWQFPTEKMQKTSLPISGRISTGRAESRNFDRGVTVTRLDLWTVFCSFDLWDMFEGYNWNRHVMTCLEDFPSSGKGTHPRFVEDRGYIYFLMLSWVDMLNPCVNEEAAMTNTRLNKHWPTVEVLAAYIYK